MNVPVDQAKPIRQGEGVDVARLEAHLVAQLPSASGPLVVEQFPSGFSNLTYLIKLGPQEFVLRRPPVGNMVKSAHDMGREFRVLSKLYKVYPPAPKPLLFCADEQVIGSPFYVMHLCRGVILRKSNTPDKLTKNPKLVSKLCESFIDGLAQLHGLDYRTAGLEDLGKPQGYVQRQVTGWVKRYAQAKTDEFPEIEQLGAWLTDNMPSDSPPAPGQTHTKSLVIQGLAKGNRYSSLPCDAAWRCFLCQCIALTG